MTLLILALGAWIVMTTDMTTSGAFTIGMLVAFQMFAGRLSQPMLRLVGLWQEFQQAAIAVRRLGDIMNAPVEPHTLLPARASSELVEVEAQDVAFRYQENRPYLYEKLNLRLRPGACVALFFGLVAAYRIWPFATPSFGLALEFTLAALAAVLVSPRRIAILGMARETVKRLLPLLATTVVVGMLQQIMTATGVRGLLSFAAFSTPLVLLFILLPIIIPFSEGVLTYGAAAILGIPLIWFLDSIVFHATVVIAGLSLLWPLGDGLPPTALIGRLSTMVSGYQGSYKDFLKATWLPWLVITAAAMAMILFSTKLAFLVKWSM